MISILVRRLSCLTGLPRDFRPGMQGFIPSVFWCISEPVGIIAPVTEMFCGQCSRIRLTADGQLRTCLFSTTEYNLRDVLRSGASRTEIVEFIEDAVFKKEPRHFINDAEFAPASRSMSFIGG